eukprot:16433638-Heterocapsa_arctica.AAC.2
MTRTPKPNANVWLSLLFNSIRGVRVGCDDIGRGGMRGQQIMYKLVRHRKGPAREGAATNWTSVGLHR